MKYIHFYAFGEDILEVLNAVEAELEPVRFPTFFRRKKTLGFWFDKIFNPEKAASFSQSVLQYVPTGSFTKRPKNRFISGAGLPDLGIASDESGIGCEAYVVTGTNVSVKTRIVATQFGTRYLIDQLINPETVVLKPAGLWKDKVLLSGSISTVSDTGFAQYLMKAFHKAIKKRFTKVRAYWIGPEALAFMQAGGRLTIAVQSPPEFDLQA